MRNGQRRGIRKLSPLPQWGEAIIRLPKHPSQRKGQEKTKDQKKNQQSHGAQEVPEIMDLARIPTPQNIMYIKLYIVIPQQFSYHHQSHKVQCCALGAVSCREISFSFPIFPHQGPQRSRTSLTNPPSRYSSTSNPLFQSAFPRQSSLRKASQEKQLPHPFHPTNERHHTTAKMAFEIKAKIANFGGQLLKLEHQSIPPPHWYPIPPVAV